ncbi:ovostatin-like [Elgaria multicarinata webbii]|uniref:ovostatin-like n=1 Tax=Elgaria multicarinata webbii TaxID=159646 RepID=UPI002FCCCFC1
MGLEAQGILSTPEAVDGMSLLQYLLAVPSVLQTDSPNTACVHLLNLNESLDLNVLLEYEGRNTTVLAEHVTERNIFKCSNFMVPPASSNPLAFITISFKGAILNGSERRAVAIQNVGSVVFVQTDKPIYKPGQNVLIRVVALDTSFKPVPEIYPLITIQDPQNNRLFQWINVTSRFSIIQLSFQLISEPMLGNYQIMVEKKSGTKFYYSFSVEEYVLPKFDVTINAPKTVSVENPDFMVKVCGMYTYGQPLEGNAQFSVCRNLNFFGNCKRDPICESIKKELSEDGCLSYVFNSKTFELNRSGYWMNLDVKAIVTEKGTGVQIDRSTSISISRVLGRVTFENMDQDYRKGIQYCGQLKLVGVDDSPLANELVQLLLNNKNVGNYSTGANGMAQFCIDTSEILSPDFSLRLIYQPHENCNSDGWLLPYYPEASHSVQRFYSRTGSFVKIHRVFEDLPCGQRRPIKVSYILNNIQDNTEDVKGGDTATFYYIVLVKNKFVHSGKHTINFSHASKGSFNIPFAVSPTMAPVATLLVYTLHPDSEVVADVARFQIEKCFKNKVRLQFSEKQALPASNISLRIEAAANSHCALRAVDQSVLLLRPERELSAESVYSLLPYQMFGYYFNGLNLEDDPNEPCIPPDNIFYNGLFYVPADFSYGPDIYGLIKNTGVKFVTNSRLRQPIICSSGRPFPHSFEDSAGRFPTTTFRPTFAGDISGSNVIMETVRKFFPETWIWDLFLMNSTGYAELSYIIPDTITEWKANAFCVAQEAGFGISGPASLVAFLPFFVDLTLPYAIVRGEDFLLKANVFNYLGQCIQVSVSLAQSQDFQAHLLSPVSDNGCLCGSERKTYIWNITSKILGEVTFFVTAEAPQTSRACGNGTSGGLEMGRKDTLIRTLLVQPEGVEREATQSSFICAKEGAVFSEPVSLKLPENLVEGSARASFSCIGDLMGTAMQNLQQLLRMPFGCGEQNMALFAPNIYILDYLNATGQLTEEIKLKATGYLVSGYQGQLSYKHSDGSYSAFGSRDKEGNSWLTAFVYKCFASASRDIYIDPNVQTQSLLWLSNKQKSDGCFQNVGKLFNNALKGGVQDELSLSAYITSALLESGLPTVHPVVRNALYCLEAGLEKGNITVYDQALVAYAFGLAGNKPKRDFLLDELNKTAKKVGGSIHWERDDKPSAEQLPSFYSRASSAEVETASYVLLALLTESNPTSAQMAIASQIVHWVTKQQNSHGGFSTTQDTVVAIQALAKFSQLTFSKDGQNSVKIHSAKPFEKVFEVDNSNRLLLQQTSLPDVPGEYTVDVNGKGCVFVQTSLRYNIILPQRSSGFSISVQTSNASCAGSFQIKFAVGITARYTGKRNSSNMVIIDVKMITGFIPERSSLQKLRGDNNVMKVETKENHVLCYLEELSKKEISLSFIVVQDLSVSNLKAASVRIYDYYETDEIGVAEYESPCKEGDS